MKVYGWDKIKSFNVILLCVLHFSLIFCSVLPHLTEWAWGSGRVGWRRQGNNMAFASVWDEETQGGRQKEWCYRIISIWMNHDLPVIYINGLSCVWLANEPWFEHSWILRFDNLFFFSFSLIHFSMRPPSLVMER
jgi:hypothetical protein